MDDVRKFGISIKKKYKERRINYEEQWPPCHSNKIVRLDLVERKKGEFDNSQRGGEDSNGKRTPLAYGDLFTVKTGIEKPVRKVLVEGDAGIGKTTFCISVSEEWANGKLFQQFELVLLLPLRTKVVASAGSLPELLSLLHSSQRLCYSVARYLEEEEGESVLIIADGWDELSESERHNGSFLYQLLFEKFPLMSVVLTSRSSMSASLHQLPCFDRFVEVRGFSKEDIVEFIQSEFTGKHEKTHNLLERLENNLLIESVCSVPLNCALVCHLWHTLEEALPTTTTELYTKMILKFVLRNIRKIDSYVPVLDLSTFESLPADLQQSWWLMCQFAFQTLEKDLLVFSQEEVELFFPKGLAFDKRILCFGILQSTKSIGFGVSFHFLHLTFQEYLAALHLARQPPNKQLEMFHLHKPKDHLSPSRFAMVWRFFFGINDFKAETSTFIKQIFECVAGDVQSTFFQSILSICHCTFEARNDLINNETARYLVSHSRSLHSSSGINFGYPLTAHDCAAVLYVIDKMQGYDGCMEVDFGNCGVRENQIRELINIMDNKIGKLQIIKLNLTGSRLTLSGLQVLENAVHDNLFTKLEKLFLADSLTNDADTNAAWLNTFVKAILSHCPCLWYLDLSHNNLGVPGASAISKNYDYTYRSCYLDLGKTNLGDNGLTALIENLKIDHLVLADNDIHVTSVLCLADVVCSGRLVIHSRINLSDNPLGREGAMAVSRLLGSDQCQVGNVNLSNCELTTAEGDLLTTPGGRLSNTDTLKCTTCEAIGQHFYQMPQNVYVTWLVLNDNSFTGEGIHILAGFMYLCSCLKCLYTCGCGITSDDLIWLFDKLTQLKSSRSSPLCTKLEMWNLGDNQINDSGVLALMDHLPSLFPHLWTHQYSDLHSYNNPISSEAMERLNKEVRKCRQQVITLLLGCNYSDL